MLLYELCSPDEERDEKRTSLYFYWIPSIIPVNKMELEKIQNTQPISLASYLAVIKKRRRIIIYGTLFCAAVATIISFLIPKVYEARASLLIMPPRFQTELKPVTFSPPTYQSWLESKEFAKKIIEKLNLKKITVEELQRNMQTKLVIEERGINQKSFAPIIHLIVRADSPKKAAAIANTWAELFLEANRKLSGRETESSYDFLTSQYTIATANLADAEEKLRLAKDKWKLELLKSQLEAVKTKLEGTPQVPGQPAGYRAMYTDLRYQLDSAKAKLARLKEQITVQEENGQWIGNIRIGEELKDIKQIASNAGNENLRAELKEIRNAVLAAKKNLIEAQEALEEYFKENKLEMLKKEFEEKNSHLVKYRLELADIEVRMKSLKDSLDETKKQIESQDKFISLKKAITDEALWNKIVSSGSLTEPELEKLKGLQLETEEVNPIYLGLVKQWVDLQVELNTLIPKQKFLDSKIKEIESEIKLLDTKLKRMERELESLNTRLSIAKKNYQELANKYTQLKAEFNETQLEVDILSAREAEMAKTIAVLEAQAKQIQEKINLGELEIAELERAVSIYKDTFNLLAKKVEEAKITKAEQLTEDIKIAAYAVEPQKRIWPKRKLIVGISTFVGFVISLSAAFLQEYLEKSPV